MTIYPPLLVHVVIEHPLRMEGREGSKNPKKSAYGIYERYLIARNVEDADLAKNGAVAQGHEHGCAVVSDYVELALW